jgi:hypothetical protein
MPGANESQEALAAGGLPDYQEVDEQALFEARPPAVAFANSKDEDDDLLFVNYTLVQELIAVGKTGDMAAFIAAAADVEAKVKKVQ